MSEKKGHRYTPGPWKVSEDDPFYVTSEDYGGIAMVFHVSTNIGEHRQWALENAHLIAAAPDLLSACEDAANVIGRIPSFGDDIGNVSKAELGAIHNNLRKVINKALGNEED